MEWRRASNFNQLKEDNHDNRDNHNNSHNRNNIQDNERGNRYNNTNNERGNRYNNTNNERGNRYNNTNNERGNRYNNTNNERGNRYNRREDERDAKRKIEKDREVNQFNFPDLVEGLELQHENNNSNEYLNKIKLIHEEEENSGKLMLRDKNNWRGNIWIGPKFIKADNFSEEHENQIKSYLNVACKNASSIILPLRKTYYSRNNVDWYESWEKTFTEDELMNMNIQVEREEQEDFNKRMIEGLEILYQKRKEESDIYYEETGEVDDFAIAEIEHDNYEKWLEEFEKQFEDEDIYEEYYEDDEMEIDN
jgi:hypothetical protein